jgi:hypothetical protein
MRMRTVIATLVVLAPLLLASCAPTAMPPTFLRTESAAWTRWLDAETHYGSFSGLTVREVLRDLSGPAELRTDEVSALDRRIVHVDVAGLTVREALWKVSRDYGITMAWATTHEPRTFMGVLETEEQEAPTGVRTMTEVMQRDYGHYLKMKEEKRIYREEIQDGILFYAVQERRDVRFPNGTSAWFAETERYKTPLPAANRLQTQIPENMPPDAWRKSYPAIIQAIADSA